MLLHLLFTPVPRTCTLLLSVGQKIAGSRCLCLFRMAQGHSMHVPWSGKAQLGKPTGIDGAPPLNGRWGDDHWADHLMDFDSSDVMWYWYKVVRIVYLDIARWIIRCIDFTTHRATPNRFTRQCIYIYSQDNDLQRDVTMNVLHRIIVRSPFSSIHWFIQRVDLFLVFWLLRLCERKARIRFETNVFFRRTSRRSWWWWWWSNSTV